MGILRMVCHVVQCRAATEQKKEITIFNGLSSFCPSLVLAFHHGGFVLRDWPSAKNPCMAFPNRPYIFRDDGSVSGVVNSCDS